MDVRPLGVASLHVDVHVYDTKEEKERHEEKRTSDHNRLYRIHSHPSIGVMVPVCMSSAFSPSSSDSSWHRIDRQPASSEIL